MEGTLIILGDTLNGLEHLLDGQLTEIQRVDIEGGVYAAFYGSSSALAVPH
jgi:hypothetical protein